MSATKFRLILSRPWQDICGVIFGTALLVTVLGIKYKWLALSSGLTAALLLTGLGIDCFMELLDLYDSDGGPFPWEED